MLPAWSLHRVASPAIDRVRSAAGNVQQTVRPDDHHVLHEMGHLQDRHIAVDLPEPMCSESRHNRESDHQEACPPGRETDHYAEPADRFDCCGYWREQRRKCGGDSALSQHTCELVKPHQFCDAAHEEKSAEKQPSQQPNRAATSNSLSERKHGTIFWDSPLKV